MSLGCSVSTRCVAALGCAALVASLGLAAEPAAQAKASYDSPYGYSRTWNAALRFLRVDSGWKVTEKDESSGYLLFEYKSTESAKMSPGAVELVRGRDDNGPVGVVVELSAMPRYHEQLVLDALAAKMRREYGDPPPRAPQTPPVADGGADAGT